MWMRPATLMLIGLVCLPGCGGSGSRSVTLEVSSVAPDGRETPLATAFVRSIPIDTSPVPLPINSRTLKELGGIKQDSDFTDEQGRATLAIGSEQLFQIEVVEPITSIEVDKPVWTGLYDPSSGNLTPSRAVEGMQVRLIR